jgi:hypothetical protein
MSTPPEKKNTNDKIADLRLVSHQLLDKTKNKKIKTPQEIVLWMGAIQAQDYNMAKWAIGVRLDGYTDKMVEDAFNQGQFLRTHVLRPTWHFVAPATIRWMLQLSAERIKSSARSRDRDLEISESLYTRTNTLIQKALEGKQLTRNELSEALEKAGIKVDSSRMVHFMMRAEVEGIVCSGAMQGKNQTYALLDERVAPQKSLPKEESLANLAQIYFNSHSPATLQDYVWWSGLSLTEAKQGLEAVKQDFYTEEINGRTYLISNTIKNIMPNEDSVYLLPAFDEYLIAYRDREAVFNPKNHSKAISSNGIFRPVIVVNGQVVGTWKKTTAKSNPIRFELFEAVEADTYDRIQQSTIFR